MYAYIYIYMCVCKCNIKKINWINLIMVLIYYITCATGSTIQYQGVEKRKAPNSRRTVSTFCTVGPNGKPSFTVPWCKWQPLESPATKWRSFPFLPNLYIFYAYSMGYYINMKIDMCTTDGIDWHSAFASNVLSFLQIGHEMRRCVGH